MVQARRDSATPLRFAQNDEVGALRFAQNDEVGALRFAQNDGSLGSALFCEEFSGRFEVFFGVDAWRDLLA